MTDKHATDHYKLPTGSGNSVRKRICASNGAILPVPLAHRTKTIRPEDDVESSSDVMATRHSTINTSHDGTNDVPHDLGCTRGHY